jgi:hypothetical protein
MRARALLRLLLPVLLVSAALAQDFTLPEVVMLPVEPVSLHPGESVPIRLSFRIKDGFHINSSKPIQQNLSPTSVRFSPPSDILVGKFTYPAGELMQLPFMPDEKLSVYSGAFQVSGLLKTTNAISPSTYRVRGVLRYQACTDRQCFPPRTTEFAFDVKVVRVKHPRRNPPQSPHAHS